MIKTQSTAARQRAYKARKQAQGLVRVSEWVHKDDAAKLRFRAKEMRLYRDMRDPKFVAYLLANVGDGK